MSKKLLILLLLSFVSSISFAQPKRVELTVKQPIGSTVRLARYVGKNVVEVDSMRLSSTGSCNFVLPAHAPKGLYRISVGKGASFDFLLTDEPEYVFETYSFAIEDSLKVIRSVDNKFYLEFRKLKQSAEQRMWLIESLRKFYDRESMFAQMLMDEYKRIGFELYVAGNDLALKAANPLVSSVIRMDLTPFVVVATNECSYKKEQADVWWVGIDLSNPDVRNLPRFTTRLWDYVENLLCEGSYSKEEQDSVFAAYLQKLFAISMHDSVRAAMVNSLCRGFAESDYYGVVSLLDSKRRSGECKELDEPELKIKLQLEQELMPGKKAYDFKVKPFDQKKSFLLSKSSARYTLVVFWSVWCPHCTESLPQIYSIYKDFSTKGFDVVAICIDDEDDAFRDFCQKNGLTWRNMRIPLSSENKVLIKYNVDETPKMFLIDKKLTIISRPSTPEHLRAALNRVSW